MTLGNAAAAKVRLIVWCKSCGHQVEPDPAEHAARYGAEMTVPDWQKRLVCSGCGSREIDMMATGTARQPSPWVGSAASTSEDSIDGRMPAWLKTTNSGA